MTVTANDLLIGPVVVADGVSTIAVDFLVEDASWLEVYKSGSETPLILDTDYTFTGEGTDSGTVTLTVAADGVDSYSVYLIQPKERSSDIQFRGGLSSGPLNIELDRIWRAIQGVTTALDRTLRVTKVANTPAPLNTETAAERANNSLGFSADGTTLIVGPSLEDIAQAQPSASAAAASALEASGFADDAEASALLAQDWAAEDEDVEVSGGLFSALHYAAKAAASAASIVPSLFMTKAANLSDLADAATARVNLGVTSLLALKANLASPEFTGTPTAPTAAYGTDTTQIATMAALVDRDTQAGTPVASTSGTTIDFTGIPAGVQEVEVIFDSVSLSGTNNYIIQIGISSGFVVTGYTSTTVRNQTDGNGNGTDSTTGFVIRGGDASHTLTGSLYLRRFAPESNVWVANHNVKTSPSITVTGAGRIDLGAELDRVRIIPSISDTFDGGQVNVRWK